MQPKKIAIIASAAITIFGIYKWKKGKTDKQKNIGAMLTGIGVGGLGVALMVNPK